MQGEARGNAGHAFEVVGTCRDGRAGQGEPILSGHHRRGHR